MIYVSCAPGNMYRNGAWYDDPVLLNEFTNGETARHAPRIVAEIYPPYSYDRGDPFILGGGAHELERVRSVAHGTLRDFTAGPATVLALATNCCVSRSVVYLLRDDRTYVVYETHRPNDRSVSLLRNDSEIRLVETYKRADPFVAYLWVGSAGSMNYGHWLVDDLPRLRALVELRRIRPYAKIVIVTPDCGPVHNAVHTESAGAIAAALEVDNVEMLTVDREDKVFFEELYFVTPVTHHPVLKSPDAMDFAANHLLDALRLDPAATNRPAGPKRLYVGRSWTGQRDLANQAEIVSLLAAQGFVAVETGDMPVLAQAELFANAELVVGCMGASMTNTLFCPPGTKVGLISPQGWIETFYWDLAAARKQQYAACYGASNPEQAPAWKKNFRVNPVDVETMLQALFAMDKDPERQEPPGKATPEIRDSFNPFAR